MLKIKQLATGAFRTLCLSGMLLGLIVLGLTPELIIASEADSQLSAYEKEVGDSGLHLFPSSASSHMCLLLPSAGSCAV